MLVLDFLILCILLGLLLTICPLRAFVPLLVSQNSICCIIIYTTRGVLLILSLMSLFSVSLVATLFTSIFFGSIILSFFWVFMLNLCWLTLLRATRSNFVSEAQPLQTPLTALQRSSARTPAHFMSLSPFPFLWKGENNTHLAVQPRGFKLNHIKTVCVAFSKRSRNECRTFWGL